MTKLFTISNPKTQQHIGSIIADRIVCDPSDNYLLFLDGNKTVAMFPAENIEIENAKDREEFLRNNNFSMSNELFRKGRSL